MDGVGPDSVYRWIQSLSKGDVIVLFLTGVAMFTYYKLISKKVIGDIKKMPRPNDVLSKTEHAVLCREAMKEIKDEIVGNRQTLMESFKDMKENVLLEMENKILKEIRKLNHEESR